MLIKTFPNTDEKLVYHDYVPKMHIDGWLLGILALVIGDLLQQQNFILFWANFLVDWILE